MNCSVAGFTNGNYVQPMFPLIPFIVMIFYSRLIANYACQSGGTNKATGLDLIIDETACLAFQGAGSIKHAVRLFGWFERAELRAPLSLILDGLFSILWSSSISPLCPLSFISACVLSFSELNLGFLRYFLSAFCLAVCGNGSFDTGFAAWG